MSLAFVPLYVDLLGVESFGIIGIYTLIQSWLALFAAGIRPMLSREMARWKSGILSGLAVRNILRSAEILVLAIGIVSMVTMLGVSGIIAPQSEASRGGEAGVSTCRSRGSPYPYTNKK